MKYFNTLPSVITVNPNGNADVLKNLVVRAKLLTQIATNSLVFYKYTVQEGDSPEIVAYKYYGDQYRYWLVLLANEAVDPLWNWPLTSNMFADYITDKYSEAANTQNVLEYTQTNIHHYEKLITTYDDDTQVTVIKNLIIDQNTYNTTVEKTLKGTFGYGDNITHTTSKKAVSIYDYENDLNESKRDIKLINSNYISDLELQFQVAMSS